MRKVLTLVAFAAMAMFIAVGTAGASAHPLPGRLRRAW